MGEAPDFKRAAYQRTGCRDIGQLARGISFTQILSIAEHSVGLASRGMLQQPAISWFSGQLRLPPSMIRNREIRQRRSTLPEPLSAVGRCGSAAARWISLARIVMTGLRPAVCRVDYRYDFAPFPTN